MVWGGAGAGAEAGPAGGGGLLQRYYPCVLW